MTPILDPKTVAQLRELGDAFEHIVQTYAEDLDSRFEGLANALQANDTRAMVAILHTLKGSSLTVGAAAAGQMAAEIEHAARFEERPPGFAEIAALREATWAAVHALQSAASRPDE